MGHESHDAPIVPVGVPAGRASALGTLRRLTREPVVMILALAGAVDLASDTWAAHGLVLLAAAGAVAYDVARGPRPVRAASVPVPTRAHLTWRNAALALAFAVLAGLPGRYSWPGSLAVTLPAVGAVALAWRRGGNGTPTPVSRTGTLTWAGLFIAMALFELATLLQQPTLTQSSWAHPTISTLMDPILATTSGRIGFITLWLWAGLWLLDR